MRKKKSERKRREKTTGISPDDQRQDRDTRKERERDDTRIVSRKVKDTTVGKMVCVWWARMTRGTSHLLPAFLSLSLAPLSKVACQMHCKMKRRLPFVLPEKRAENKKPQRLHGLQQQQVQVNHLLLLLLLSPPPPPPHSSLCNIQYPSPDLFWPVPHTSRPHKLPERARERETRKEETSVERERGH